MLKETFKIVQVPLTALVKMRVCRAARSRGRSNKRLGGKEVVFRGDERAKVGSSIAWSSHLMKKFSTRDRCTLVNMSRAANMSISRRKLARSKARVVVGAAAARPSNKCARAARVATTTLTAALRAIIAPGINLATRPCRKEVRTRTLTAASVTITAAAVNTIASRVLMLVIGKNWR